VDYRLSTWQEQLRNYGSIVMVLVVILLSYGVYAVGFSGGGSTSTSTVASPVQESPKTNFLSDVSSPLTNMFTGTGTEEEEEEEEEETEYNPPPPKRNFVNPPPPAVMPNLAPKPPAEEGGLFNNAMKNFNPLQ
jgi:hypothetical protein